MWFSEYLLLQSEKNEKQGPIDMSPNKDVVVFIVRRETQCSNCNEELGSGGFIYLENKQPLCLSCADLDHLDYLPSGNTALTRRAIKHSRIHAVVVQWSRTRKRYERQGILAEPKAIQRAMQDCLADAEIRKMRRQCEQQKREEMDLKYIKEFATKIRKLFPRCPAQEEVKIAQHACRKYSGRVGRSSAAKDFEPRNPLPLPLKLIYAILTPITMTSCWKVGNEIMLEQKSVTK